MLDVRKRFTTALKDTVEEWKQNKNVEGIFVLGSYVRGTITANSDLDLCIVWKEPEAPVRLLAEHMDVRIDMIFLTDDEIEGVLKGTIDDEFKIAGVIGTLRMADPVYDPEGALKNWQKRASKYVWPTEIVGRVKQRAITALNTADDWIEQDDPISAVHDIRSALFDIGRVILMRNNYFSIIKSAEVLSEIRMLDPMTYQLFLRTFKLKGLEEEQLIDILTDVNHWLGVAIERYEDGSSDLLAPEHLSQAQRDYYGALGCTYNGDFELAVLEMRHAVYMLGRALLALDDKPNDDRSQLVCELRENEPEFFSDILVEYGAFDFTAKGIKRSISEAKFIANRL